MLNLIKQTIAKATGFIEGHILTKPRFVDVIGTGSLESLDVRKFAQFYAAFEAAQFYSQHLYNAEFYDSYLDHVAAMAKRAAAQGDGAFLEFGVATGTTIKLIAAASGRPVTGFDSFQGLPEDWRYGVKRGAFALKVPVLPDSISLKIGLIEETLPLYLSDLGGKSISFVHIDTDLYKPAKLILSLCRQFFRQTVIVFDEFFNYPGWRDHEYRAFTEFQEEHGDEFHIGYLGLGGATAVSALVTRKSPTGLQRNVIHPSGPNPQRQQARP